MPPPPHTHTQKSTQNSFQDFKFPPSLIGMLHQYGDKVWCRWYTVSNIKWTFLIA